MGNLDEDELGLKGGGGGCDVGIQPNWAIGFSHLHCTAEEFLWALAVSVYKRFENHNHVNATRMHNANPNICSYLTRTQSPS
ncbi:unnamed protein product [Sphenostylis stenocarpa]|uniref:Uncharacterized protein n=1 Tax=Sphenostylis stenocarpa TaxID=92480 RepID=A0AA86SFM8_9FABA|nr:unnamed protein product [Sphenostylis stenocarpa]